MMLCVCMGSLPVQRSRVRTPALLDILHEMIIYGLEVTYGCSLLKSSYGTG